ncbi:MAG: glycosyltransferase [Gammaproteobacteria bacterium]
MAYDVVIRCKNEIEWLPRVIDSLNKQTIQPSKIILVDNSSNDGSIEYATSKGCNIIHYDKKKFNYSYALNIGIKETSQKEVLLLSAHCEIVNKDSIENLIQVRHAYKAAGVFGRQIPTVNSNPIDTRDLVTVFGRERIVYEKFPFFHNAFSLIHRIAWEDCPFDEKQNGIEDRFWAREQALKGRKIVYEPDSVVFHEHGLNQGFSMERAIRVCENLKDLHNNDIFDWPLFKN